MRDELVDFVVVGAAKCGTTALDEYLRQHPDLTFPDVREPNYFAFAGSPPEYRDHQGRPAPIVASSITDETSYRSSFDSRGLRGETSPAYLYVPGTAERMARLAPGARIIAILREPAARAFSAYQHLVREGREPLSFTAALDAEDERIAQGWGLLWRYVDTGRYATQLRRFARHFPADRILVLRHEELRSDPLAVCRRVFEFLDVDATVEVDTSTRFNVSGVPQRRWLHRLSTPPPAVRRWVNRHAPSGLRDLLARGQAEVHSRNLERATAPPSALARIRRELGPEVDALEDLLGWDLSSWRSAP
jgi:hypothetical protein